MKSATRTEAWQHTCEKLHEKMKWNKHLMTMRAVLTKEVWRQSFISPGTIIRDENGTFKPEEYKNAGFSVFSLGFWKNDVTIIALFPCVFSNTNSKMTEAVAFFNFSGVEAMSISR